MYYQPNYYQPVTTPQLYPSSSVSSQQTQQIVGQILGNAGRFVAWAPSGSADATKVVTTAG